MRNPFSRKSQDEVLPTEIKEYYTSEQRDRTGATWLMGAAVFIITVIAVLAVFYGGRALYRVAFDDDPFEEVPAEQAETSAGDEEVEVVDLSDETDTDENANATDDTEDTQEENTSSSENRRSNRNSSAANHTPNTGPSELPNTGPGN